MENQNNPEENQLQIELTPEVAQGTYTNLAILSHSHSEFIAELPEQKQQGGRTATPFGVPEGNA